MKKIILVSGLAQHGKDSTANILKKYLQGKTLILHHADYLKYIATAYMGWDGQKDEEGRHLLQWLGTDRVRIELKRPTYWVEKTCDVIQFLESEYDYFIVPDTRFQDEVYLTQARFPEKVTTIRVTRLNFENCLTPEQRNHPSETGLSNFAHDIYIDSESGLDKLEYEILRMLWAVKI